MCAGLKREFPLHESLKLAFQAESFNLTNTPSFSNPSANISKEDLARSHRLARRVHYVLAAGSSSDRQAVKLKDGTHRIPIGYETSARAASFYYKGALTS